jgi:lysophospholipase L1-like esterase
MHRTRRSKRGLVLSLLRLVVLVGAVTLSVSLQRHPSQAHAAGAVVASQGQPFHLVGPKQHYLALGDSLAFGFQPNGDFTDGYVPDLFQILRNEGVKDVTNYGCPGETSATFINGGCPFAPAGFVQITAALAFIRAHVGKVSPVTLDIGPNDVLPDLNPSTCAVDVSTFNADLATLDTNLTQVILPQLHKALLVKGHVTGDLVMMNFYDPFQNFCPNTVAFIQTFDQHLAADVSGFGIIVDVFSAFGGEGVPNPNICIYTWMCTPPPLGPNIHPTDLGYSVIANTFAAAIPTD